MENPVFCLSPTTGGLSTPAPLKAAQMGTSGAAPLPTLSRTGDTPSVLSRMVSPSQRVFTCTWPSWRKEQNHVAVWTVPAVWRDSRHALTARQLREWRAVWRQSIFTLLASLEGAQGDTGVAFESCPLFFRLAVEHEYLVKTELWLEGYVDFVSTWLNCYSIAHIRLQRRGYP